MRSTGIEPWTLELLFCWALTHRLTEAAMAEGLDADGSNTIGAMIASLGALKQMRPLLADDAPSPELIERLRAHLSRGEPLLARAARPARAVPA